VARSFSVYLAQLLDPSPNYFVTSTLAPVCAQVARSFSVYLAQLLDLSPNYFVIDTSSGPADGYMIDFMAFGLLLLLSALLVVGVRESAYFISGAWGGIREAERAPGKRRRRRRPGPGRLAGRHVAAAAAARLSLTPSIQPVAGCGQAAACGLWVGWQPNCPLITAQLL
jgi:hypothetical protein